VVRVLFLDVDGVLNRTGFHPGVSVGLRSWIEPELAKRLSDVLRVTGAEIVLASDWRRDRELQHLRDELRAAGVDGSLLDMTPILGGQARWREIEAWMIEHDVGPDAIAIVDDSYDMGALAARFVRASPLNGLDEEAAGAIVALFERDETGR
jgi:HAD domain in Swiss Army Knife RNA repair proteins